MAEPAYPQATEAVEKMGDIQQSLDTLVQIVERAQALGNRVRVVNDRMFADTPDTPNKNEPKPVRSGQIGNLQTRLEDAHDALGELDHEIGRIEHL